MSSRELSLRLASASVLIEHSDIRDGLTIAQYRAEKAARRQAQLASMGRLKRWMIRLGLE